MAAAATMSGVRDAPEQSDIPAPAGWPADLPPPEPLTAATSKEAGPIEELAGEFCARAAYSKNWQLREAAVTWLMGQVKDGAVSLHVLLPDIVCCYVLRGHSVVQQGRTTPALRCRKRERERVSVCVCVRVCVCVCSSQTVTVRSGRWWASSSAV